MRALLLISVLFLHAFDMRGAQADSMPPGFDKAFIEADRLFSEIRQMKIKQRKGNPEDSFETVHVEVRQKILNAAKKLGIAPERVWVGGMSGSSKSYVTMIGEFIYIKGDFAEENESVLNFTLLHEAYHLEKKHGLVKYAYLLAIERNRCPSCFKGLDSFGALQKWSSLCGKECASKIPRSMSYEQELAADHYAYCYMKKHDLELDMQALEEMIGGDFVEDSISHPPGGLRLRLMREASCA